MFYCIFRPLDIVLSSLYSLSLCAYLLAKISLTEIWSPKTYFSYHEKRKIAEAARGITKQLLETVLCGKETAIFSDGTMLSHGWFWSISSILSLCFFQFVPKDFCSYAESKEAFNTLAARRHNRSVTKLL